MLERNFADRFARFLPVTLWGQLKFPNLQIPNRNKVIVEECGRPPAPDRSRTFCIYDGPSPESVRRFAARNKLPITKIREVRVLDLSFYSSDL